MQQHPKLTSEPYTMNRTRDQRATFPKPAEGETLVQYRMRCGFRRASHLAAEVGFNPSTISRAETGRVMSDGVVQRLARFFRIHEEAVERLIENCRTVGNPAAPAIVDRADLRWESQDPSYEKARALAEAVKRLERKTGRPLPTWCDVVRVLEELGWSPPRPGRSPAAG